MPMHVEVVFDPAAEISRIVWFVRRHWLSAVVGAAVGAGAAGGHLHVAKRVYMADAKILIADRASAPKIRWPAGAQEPVREDKTELPTTIGILQSRMIVNRAIDAIGLKSLPSLADSEDPVEDAGKALWVGQPDKTSRIIGLSFKGRSKVEARRFVSEILTQFKKFQSQDVTHGSNQRVLDMAGRSQRELDEDVRAARKKLQTFILAHPGLTPGAKGEQRKTPSMIAVEDACKLIADVDAKLVRSRGAAEMARTMKSRGASDRDILTAVAELGIGTELIRGEERRDNAEYVKNLIRERQQLVDKFGPSSSKALEIDARLDALRGGGADLVDVLDRAATGLERTKAACEERIAVASERSNSEAIILDEGRTLQAEVERLEALRTAVADQRQIGNLSDGTEQNPFTVIDPPKARKKAVSPNTKLELGGGIGLGGILGLLLAKLRDRRR